MLGQVSAKQAWLMKVKLSATKIFLIMDVS
jgi:hypothetical protein